MLELFDTPPVVADESNLKFVFSSLIGNAIDSLFDRPVRTLTIRTGSTKDELIFRSGGFRLRNSRSEPA